MWRHFSDFDRLGWRNDVKLDLTDFDLCPFDGSKLNGAAIKPWNQTSINKMNILQTQILMMWSIFLSTPADHPLLMDRRMRLLVVRVFVLTAINSDIFHVYYNVDVIILKKTIKKP